MYVTSLQEHRQFSSRLTPPKVLSLPDCCLSAPALPKDACVRLKCGIFLARKVLGRLTQCALFDIGLLVQPHTYRQGMNISSPTPLHAAAREKQKAEGTACTPFPRLNISLLGASERCLNHNRSHNRTRQTPRRKTRSLGPQLQLQLQLHAQNLLIFTPSDLDPLSARRRNQYLLLQVVRRAEVQPEV